MDVPTFSPETLLRRLDQLLQGARPPRLWIACSGGLDSTVLAHALVRGAHGRPWALVYVDHGLHPDAPRWGQAVANLADRLGIPCERLAVTVTPAGAGLEAAARAARYRAFASLLAPGEALLTAHHADDQVETVLLRILRGTGLDGLAGMPERRPLGAGTLLRPLLPWPRAALRAYAEATGLAWIDDPANDDRDLDRNYLRHDILPRLAERFPVHTSLLRLAEHARHASEQGREARAAALRAALGADGRSLETAVLAGDRGAALALLGDWFAHLGLPPPSLDQRRRILDEVVGARPDAQPVLRLGGHCLRRHRGRMYLTPAAAPPAGGLWDWDPARPLDLPGLGTLRAEAVTGEGLRRLPGPWQVRLRAGGERIDLGGGRRPLKKILQERGIPPWERARLPLVFHRGELVAVPGVGVDRAFRAIPGNPAWRLVWTPRQ